MAQVIQRQKSGPLQYSRILSFLTKALNIEQEEFWLVRALTVQHFFQGFGVALITIIAQAVFLAEYPIKDLPLVYLLSAGVLIVVGRIYAVMEHRLSFSKLFPLVLLLVLALSVGAWAGMAFYHPAWIAIGLMVTYRVIYLLGNLEFWGLSAILFDVRQGKRLFGLISSGDVPAKLFGYLSVSALAPLIGIENLLLMAAVSFLVSFFVMQRILAKGYLKKHDHHAEHHEEGHSHHGKRQNWKQQLFGSDFVLSLAALSFFSVIVLTLIDFSFLSGVKKRFYTDVELAAFLGLFFAVGKGITIILKLFLSGRIISRLGVRRSLLILPILIVVVSLVFLADQVLVYSDSAIFWLFGVIVLVAEVFQYALNSPVFLAMFQPLDLHSRLKGHTVVKGLTDALALALAGLILLGFLKINKDPHAFLTLATLATLGLAAIWLFTVVKVNRGYLEVLKKAVKSRFLEGSNLHVVDSDSVNLLKEKLDSPYPEEVVYTLEILRNTEVPDYPEILAKMVRHPEKEVQQRALVLVEPPISDLLRQELQQLLGPDSPKATRIAAIHTWCRVAEGEPDPIYPLLQHHDPDLRSAAIRALMQTGDIEPIVLGGQALLEMISSPEERDQTTAAAVIGDLGVPKFYRPLERFLHTNSDELLSVSLLAAGKLGNPLLLPSLLDLFAKGQHRAEILKQLHRFGEPAIPYIRKYLDRPDLSRRELLEMLKVCGRIPAPASEALLWEYTGHEIATVREMALFALKAAGYQTRDREACERMLKQELDRGIQLVKARESLKTKDKLPQMAEALEVESGEALDRIMALLSFMFPQHSLDRAKNGIFSGEKEKMANALEILDTLLPNRLSGPLIALLEYQSKPGLPGYLAQAPQAFPQREDVLHFVIEEGDGIFNRWTLAVALDRIHRLQLKLSLAHIQSYRKHPDLLISQLAAKFAEDLPKSENMEPVHLLEIEKVIVLKNTQLFSQTPEEFLVDVARIVEARHFPKGEMIVQKGDHGDCMYIIYQGKVRVHDGTTTFGHLERRDFFGELSLLDPAPRSASVTAGEDTVVLQLNQRPFYELMEERIEVGRGILATLAQRIRRDNEQIARLKAQDSLS